MKNKNCFIFISIFLKINYKNIFFNYYKTTFYLKHVLDYVLKNYKKQIKSLKSD